MRGEYEDITSLALFCIGSPPHARGIPVNLCVVFVNQGITPACAGNTLREGIPVHAFGDHPRMRGEYV